MMIKSNTNLIFAHKTIKAIADSMIKVFIPILLIKLSGNVSFAIIYMCAFFPLCSILNIVLRKFLEEYGVIAVVLHSIFIISLQFLLNLTITWWLCLIIAFLMAMGQVLYSVPVNILFSLTDKSVNVARFEIPTNIGKLIFIIFSGFILGSDIENSLLIVTIVCSILYLLSSLPLLLDYKMLKSAYIKATKKEKKLDKDSYKLYNLFHIQFGIFQYIIVYVLPVYLYVNNLEIQAVAIVLVLIEICKIFASLFARYLVKRNLSIASILISILVMVASSIIIIFIREPIVLYVCSCALGISFPLLFDPMFTIFVRKTNKDNNTFDGMTYRDAYIFSCRSFITVSYFVYPSFLIQFLVGIMCSISMGYTTVKIIHHDKKLIVEK